MKLVFVIMALVSTAAIAQNSSPGIVSPEILPDHKVTFRILAPKASQVSISGDWMAPNTPLAMTKDDKGVWSITTGPLETGRAIYTFNVDGVVMADPVNPIVKLRARTSASLVDVPGNTPELWEPWDVPHGKVEANWEKSNATGDTRAYYVYTPSGYDPSKSTRYPVLYLLHGNSDTALGWTDVGKANFILDNLLSQNKAVPMIIVMPWGHALPFVGPQTNNTATFEKYLLEEVVPQVEKKYKVAPGRDNRAIVGLSMGGGHSLQIGLSHLDMFSVVAAFSTSVPGNFETRFKTLLDDPKGTNAKLKLLWIGCGQQDPAFANNKSLSEILTRHDIKNTFYAIPGRHTFTVWRHCLVEIAPQLFRKGKS
jgi:enterochelin esterase-like enzyme